ncbi:hypothetical protein L0664_08220 [Octadecabacter sp. G9-8]|uniref:DUF2244 domain-containing protein n=1 Tax=Octadecabacter dasysiphoniae TaxID=2909341 RepID=A0ABS9CXC7_9RHOB|nr:hypothetical protein [Octadecabacter dasysiphoniae]MCF2871049.1 hypothetical protein [Octadecabacter dasysiphoniae]
MKITHDTSDLLVLRFTRWKEPLFYAVFSLVFLGAAAALVYVVDVPIWMLIAWLGASAAWSVPMALLRVEKSMLVLNATTRQAELRHRDIWGLHRHVWPLDEVQSTRITRAYGSKGPATTDPKREITLYVREGMDEGRHKLAKRAMNARDALAASARVSDWMRDWRASLDSQQPKP